MLYAINEVGEKIVPTKTGQKALCPFTSKEVISKCGPIKINHWAYKNNDGGVYKPETQWHLNWKSNFNKEFIEVLHTDKYGERHIADYDDGSKVIEFQHSPISTTEMLSRELFYTSIGRKFMWVVDGQSYFKNTDIEVIEEKTYTFKLKYCKREEREEILKYNLYGLLDFDSFSDIDDKTTTFKNMLISQKLLSYIDSLPNYKREGIKFEIYGTNYNIKLESTKNLVTMSNNKVFIDLDHVIKNHLYDIETDEMLSKEDFIRLTNKVLIKDKKKFNKKIVFSVTKD